MADTKKLFPRALIGSTYKFKVIGKANKLTLRLGVDIQKFLKVKKGSRVAIKFDAKNNNKIILSKYNSTSESRALIQDTGAKALHFGLVWKSKKPYAKFFKKSHTAKVKFRKDSVAIELFV